MKKHSQWSRIGFALAGVKAAWQRERSFQTEVVAALAVMIWMVWLEPGVFWWLSFILVTALALCAELINTAIEAMCDVLHPDQHPMIKVTKDCAAAAVLMAIVAALAVVCGLIWTAFCRHKGG